MIGEFSNRAADLWRGPVGPAVSPVAGPSGQDVVTVVRLRIGIGAIGIALPLALPLGNLIFAGVRSLSTYGWWPQSMSASYYTSTRNIFVGALCALGVVLIAYRVSKREDRFSTIAGIAAIGVALFPTTHANPDAFQTAIGVIHYISAGVLLVSLAMFCLVSFRDQTSSPQPWAKTLYLWAGVIILVAVVAAVLLALAGVGKNAPLTPVYAAEWISVWAFGAAWLYAAVDLAGRPVEA